jgi:5,5'-dehydrodivanillate O-demethylase
MISIDSPAPTRVDSAERIRERQERLTRLGPGTPMGTYLRCFWYPIAAVVEFEKWPLKKVRLLGEDLALFRSDDGSYGLLADRCAHRGTSLSCGMLDGPNVRCAYHGWTFDKTGQCVDTPAEPESSKLKDRIRIAAYEVQVLGGLVWAYLGKAPAPLLPRYEFMVSEDWDNDVGIAEIPCNWLQIVENNMDPYHVEYLHGRFANFVRGRMGLEPIKVHRHLKVKYELFAHGFVKKRLWEGATEDSQEWTIGHPLLFPTHNLVRINPNWTQIELRVPVDETNSIYYYYNCRRREPGAEAVKTVRLWDNAWKNEEGDFKYEILSAQDTMVMVTQGALTDHAAENLGESDRGVALFRRTILEQIEVALDGGDPLGVIRDEKLNMPWLGLPTETRVEQTFEGVKFADDLTLT